MEQTFKISSKRRKLGQYFCFMSPCLLHVLPLRTKCLKMYILYIRIVHSVHVPTIYPGGSSMSH